MTEKKAGLSETQQNKAFVYILLCGDGSYYTGWSNDVPARIAVHRSGKGAKYTRGRGPLELVYCEGFFDKEAAMSREAAIKKLSREKKEKLISQGPVAFSKCAGKQLPLGNPDILRAPGKR